MKFKKIFFRYITNWEKIGEAIMLPIETEIYICRVSARQIIVNFFPEREEIPNWHIHFSCNRQGKWRFKKGMGMLFHKEGLGSRLERVLQPHFKCGRLSDLLELVG